MARKLKFDEIGYWSEVKLDIIREYAAAYSTILNAQPKLSHVYIDAFAGAGVHISRRTRKFIKGSPANALLVKPPFDEYYLIDLDGRKVDSLKKLIDGKKNVFIYQGNCNSILLEIIFPNVQYSQFRRGLCLLDPYGLHLNWEVIEKAGKMNTIDIFLNFPVADMNRNVLWSNPQDVESSDIVRMNAYWGDESWRDVAYTTERDLFGYEEKVENRIVAQGFQKRLIEIAKFKCVPEPIPMRNSKGAVIYYLFFASQNDAALKIVNDIFNKYKSKGSY